MTEKLTIEQLRFIVNQAQYCCKCLKLDHNIEASDFFVCDECQESVCDECLNNDKTQEDVYHILKCNNCGASVCMNPKCIKDYALSGCENCDHSLGH